MREAELEVNSGISRAARHTTESMPWSVWTTGVISTRFKTRLGKQCIVIMLNFKTCMIEEHCRKN